MQNLRLDHTSSVDPLSLLEKIKESGISQDVCINDLGMLHAWMETLYSYNDN